MDFSYDPSQTLANIKGIQGLLLPTDEEKQHAITQGLLMGGLGILSNNSGHYGRMGPAVGAGGQEGLNAYYGDLKNNIGLRTAALDQYKSMIGLQQQMQNMNMIDSFQKALGGGPRSSVGGQTPPATQANPTDINTAPVATGTQVSNPRGMFPNIPNEAALALMSGNPGLEKMGQAIIDANKPVAMREGDLVGYDQNGKPITLYEKPPLDKGLIPVRDENGKVIATRKLDNYDAQIAATAKAKEDATQGAKIEMVKNASGAMVPARMGDLVGAPKQQMQVPGVSAPFQPSQIQQPPVQQPTARVPKSTLQKPSNDPWASIPTVPQPKGIGQSTYNQSYMQGMGEAGAKVSERLGENATAANQRIALNNQSLSLIDKADTGPLAAQASNIKNWLVSKFGISEDRFQNTPSATLALQKDLVNAATAKAKQQFGGKITQGEVNLMLTRGSPNVDMTKAALRYLLQSDTAGAQYQLDQANDFSKYMKLNGDPTQFESWYSQKFPMTNAVGSIHLNTGKQTNQDQPMPAPAQGQYKIPNQAAINDLKMNRGNSSIIKYFDATFGPGAAFRILEGK